LITSITSITTIAADCLANTGSGALPAVLAAGILLLAGIAVAVVVRRRTAGERTGGRARGLLAVVLMIGLGASVLAIGSPSQSAQASSRCGETTAIPVSGPAVLPDQPVTFESGGVTVHGTYRGAANATGSIPAAIIIVGSGNVDRDGNGVGIGSEVYEWIADVLSAQGVASLRYDKLGVGETGLGPYADNPAALATTSYDTLRVQPARDGLSFLAAQPGIDAGRLIVVGHSEGGAIALDLVNNPGSGPAPAGLALIEPSYTRLFDTIIDQSTSQLDAAVAAGTVTAPDADTLKAYAAAGVDELRGSNPPYPAPGPPPLPNATGFTAVTQSALQLAFYEFDPEYTLQTKSYRSQYGKDADELYSPDLAATIGIPTLITCGTKDEQTPCGDGTPGSGVLGVVDAFQPGVARFVQLPDTVHLLRDLGDDEVPDVQAQLAYPFSTVAEGAIGDFAAQFAALPPTAR
jgi:pimeloyl-ACP methyl ester carboxylesterase